LNSFVLLTEVNTLEIIGVITVCMEYVGTSGILQILKNPKGAVLLPEQINPEYVRSKTD